MKPKYFFAPGTVQHCRRPRSRLAPWLSLAAALGLVLVAVLLAPALGTAWSPL